MFLVPVLVIHLLSSTSSSPNTYSYSTGSRNPTLYAKKLQQSKKTKRYLHSRLTRLVIAITTQSWKQSTLVINSADLVVLIRHDMVLHPSKFSSLLHKSNS